MLSRITKSTSESAFPSVKKKGANSINTPVTSCSSSSNIDNKSNNSNNNQNTMQTLSSSTSVMQPKHLHSCRTCHMICIADTTRIMCPYCGSFYDPAFLRSKVYNNGKKSKKPSLVRYIYRLKLENSIFINIGNEYL